MDARILLGGGSEREGSVGISDTVYRRVSITTSASMLGSHLRNVNQEWIAGYSLIESQSGMFEGLQ
jgi:hypothetical protein